MNLSNYFRTAGDSKIVKLTTICGEQIHRQVNPSIDIALFMVSIDRQISVGEGISGMSRINSKTVLQFHFEGRTGKTEL